MSHRPLVLHLPADPALLRVARVTVASAAAELPFTLQDIEDLRVAVDELAAVVIEDCPDTATLQLQIEVGDDGISVVGRIDGVGPAPALHPVAEDLLGFLAPGYELGTGEGDRSFRFTKRASVHAS